MKNYQITEWCSHFIKEQVQEGDFCIDATMGNGNDTLLLSRLCGSSGRVLSFDIQKQALTNTEALLKKELAPQNYTLILDSHEHLDQYADNTPVSLSLIHI